MHHLEPYQTNLTLEGETVLTLTGEHLSFPEFRRINRYYKELECRWENHWKQELYWQACLSLAEKREKSRHFSPFQVSFRPKVDTISETILTVHLTIEEICHAKYPYVVTLHDHWDLTEQIPLSPRKLIAKLGETHPKKALLDAGPHETYPQRRAWFSPKNLFLTQDGYGIFYPQATIAPPSRATPHLFLKLR
ncbi:MAG: hypothetical protein R3Y07_09255 [Eubacteriales bacterium]